MIRRRATFKLCCDTTMTTNARWQADIDSSSHVILPTQASLSVSDMCTSAQGPKAARRNDAPSFDHRSQHRSQLRLSIPSQYTRGRSIALGCHSMVQPRTQHLVLGSLDLGELANLMDHLLERSDEENRPHTRGRAFYGESPGRQKKSRHTKVIILRCI